MTVPTDEEFLAYNKGVVAEFRAGKGVVTVPPFPVLLLTTTGARTGRVTTVPLGFGIDGGRVFVVASRAGSPRNPAWYHNLRANPSVTVELGEDTYQARAVVTDEAERARLFAAVLEQNGGFDEYRKNTDRVFPIVVLDGVRAPQPDR
jgi:deazaflavin-dependent oxidoreductase (nitroreductase family)